MREQTIFVAFAHEFGENVRGRALFAVHAYEKWENVRGRRLEGQVTGKMGGFVVGRGEERGGRDDF